MSVGWVVIGVVIAVAIIMLFTSRFRRDDTADLGTVSHQWMAEQRLGRERDSQR